MQILWLSSAAAGSAAIVRTLSTALPASAPAAAAASAANDAAAHEGRATHEGRAIAVAAAQLHTRRARQAPDAELARAALRSTTAPYRLRGHGAAVPSSWRKVTTAAAQLHTRRAVARSGHRVEQHRSAKPEVWPRRSAAALSMAGERLQLKQLAARESRCSAQQA